MKPESFILILCFILFACNSSKHIHLPERKSTAIGGNVFYKNVFAISRLEREALAKNEILHGIFLHL